MPGLFPLQKKIIRKCSDIASVLIVVDFCVCKGINCVTSTVRMEIDEKSQEKSQQQIIASSLKLEYYTTNREFCVCKNR